MKTNLGKNTLLNIIGQGIPILVALFAIPIAILHLGDTRFGILTIAWIIIGTSTLFDLGMGRATTKFIADAIGRNEPNKIPSILSCAVFVQIIIGLLGGLAIIGLAPLLAHKVLTIPGEYAQETQYVFILAGASIPIALITGSYRGLLEAAHRFDIVNIFRVVFSSLTYLTPLIGIVFGWSLVGIVSLLLGFRVVQLIALFRVSVALYPSISWIPKQDRQHFRSMFQFGGWVALSNILSPLQENMERLILAGLLPIALLTYYSVPKDMLERIHILPGSLTTALFPTIIAVAVSRKEELSKLFITATKIIIVSVSLPLFLITVLAEPLLSLWINADFAAQGTSVVQILSLGVLASSLNSLAMTLFQGVGRPDITAKQQLIRFPIIAASAWFLIAEYGLAGAAASWSFGRLLALIMNWWAIVKIKRWPMRKLVSRHIVISLLAPITLTVFCISSLSVWRAAISIQSQVLFAGIGTTLLVIIFWRYVFCHEEREWARSVHRAFQKI